MSFAAVLFSILPSFPFASFSQPTISLPTPPGPYNVYITNEELIDHSRIDPLAPCCNQSRRLMISIFQPTSCSQTTPVLYMPPATANIEDIDSSIPVQHGRFESLRLQTCPQPSSSNESFPLLLFSTGLGISRLLYSSLLQWVASSGFTIVAIDHTYDADVVEFPDGTLIHGSVIEDPEDIELSLSVRVDDTSFVLDYLSLDARNLSQLDVGMFGHSLGGATAARAMVIDQRIVGGLNFDGVIVGSALNHSNPRPFVLMAAPGQNQSDSTWAAFWEELLGQKLQIEVNGTTNWGFTDYPVLAKVLNINKTLLTGPVTGTIDGQRILEILRAYVSAFFESVFKGQKEPILQGPSESFPEVSFRNSSGWN